jgi:DNA invertase Pin-like site-specific DNA recombinase
VEQKQGYSLDEQLVAIRAYARRAWDAELPDADVFADEGLSGTLDELEDRPAFRAMAEACAEGRYTHVVIHKADRWARNTALATTIARKLERLGIPIICVAEGIDTSTPGGMQMFQSTSVFAEYFSRLLSLNTKLGKRGVLRAGLSNGNAPFGAMKDANGVLIPDARPIHVNGQDGIDGIETTRHAGLLRIVALAADGLNPRAIAEAMSHDGWRIAHPPGAQGTARPFARSTVRHILNNRLYIGEVWDGEAKRWLPGKHAPLVPLDLWERAQAQLARHRANPQTLPGGTSPHALGGGILRCAACYEQGSTIGWHIHASDTRYPSARRFVCGNREQRRGCSQSTIRADVLEGQVRTLLHLLALSAGERERLVALLEEEAKHTPAASQADVEARRRQVEDRLARERDLYRWGDTSREEYLRARTALEAELRKVAAEQRHPQLPFDAIKAVAALAATIPSAWDAASASERRQLVREVFTALWVRDGRIIAVEPTSEYVLFFQLASHAASVSLASGELTQSTSADAPGPPNHPYLPPQAIPAPPLVPVVSRQRKRPNRLTATQELELVARHNAGVPVVQLAREYTLNRHTVDRILRRHQGPKRRSPRSSRRPTREMEGVNRCG